MAKQAASHMNITVIIPTKNRAVDLIVAVESVICQTVAPHQLVVVDQSDTPKSESAIKELFKKANTEIELTYIYDRTITGLVHAKEVGVSNSTGDIVCFLEDDIELEAEYICAMKDGFRKNVGMVGCCGVVTNLAHLSKYYIYFFHLFHRGVFYDSRVGVHGAPAGTQPSLIPSRYLSGGTSAFRRKVFDVVKFDLQNNFFMLEDVDFSMRVNNAFEQASYINTKARLAHYMSPTNRAVYQQRYQRKLREFIVFYKKHGYGIQDVFALSWLLIGLIIEAIVISLRNFKLSPVKGYFLGLKDGIQWRIKVGAT